MGLPAAARTGSGKAALQPPVPLETAARRAPATPRQACFGAVSLHRACEELRRTVKPQRPPSRRAEQQSSPNLLEWLPEEKEAGCSVPPLSSLQGFIVNHITGELSFRFNSRRKRSGISRLPSGSGLARALLQVLKIASDCSEELCRVGGTSTPATHPATGRRQRQSLEAGAAWKEGGIS